MMFDPERKVRSINKMTKLRSSEDLNTFVYSSDLVHIVFGYLGRLHKKVVKLN